MTGEGTDKKYRSDVAETRHFKRKIQSVFFAAEGPDSSPVGRCPSYSPPVAPTYPSGSTSPSAQNFRQITLVPGRDGKYCDERVCLSVCLSAHVSQQELIRR